MSDAATRPSYDAQIVDLLRRDSRMTRRRMAELTGLPESTIRARLDRVLRSGRIQATVLVHPYLARSSILYMLHLELAEPGDAETLLHSTELAESPWTGQVADTGRLMVQQRAVSIEEMVARIARVRAMPEVVHAWCVIVFRVYIGAAWQGDSEAVSPWASAPTRAVDDIDLRLIGALRRDGRTSYTDLADLAELTVAATRRRVLRLVADGVIRFTARVEDEGPLFEASVDMRVAAADVDAFIDELCARPDIRYVTEQSGRQNVACYVVGADSASLAAAVDRVRSDPRVEDPVVAPMGRVRDFLAWDSAF
jgi:DNA-binding Lrp family transcriptional regulator